MMQEQQDPNAILVMLGKPLLVSKPAWYNSSWQVKS